MELYTQIHARILFRFINLSGSRTVLLYQVFIKQLIDVNLPSVLHHVDLKVHNIQSWNSIMKAYFMISSSITRGCVFNPTPEFSWAILNNYCGINLTFSRRLYSEGIGKMEIWVLNVCDPSALYSLFCIQYIVSDTLSGSLCSA